MALFDEEIRGFEHIPQGYGSEQFLDEGLLLLAAQASHNSMPSMFPTVGHRLMEPLAQLRHAAGVGALAADATRSGRVWGEFRGVPVVRYSVTPADVARLKRGLELSMQMLVAAGARRLYPGVLGMGALEPHRRWMRFRKTDVGRVRSGAGQLPPARHVPDGHRPSAPASWGWTTRATTCPGCSSWTGARCAGRSA